MAYQALSDFLHDAAFHQARVERVAKIVKAEVSNSRSADRPLPRRLDAVDGTPLERAEQSRLLVFTEQVEETVRERDFTGFPASGFAFRDVEQPPGEINVLRELPENLSPAHPAVERNNNDGAEVRSRRREQLFFFLKADDDARLAPCADHAHPSERIRGKQSFFYRPEEHVPQHFEIAIHRRVGNWSLRAAVFAVLPCLG